jgi:hypothetical protein
MTTLKVGDRIKFVGPALNVKNNEVWFDCLDGYRATVVSVMLPRHIDVFVEGCDSVRCSIHPRQVTHRLKPKENKKPREWFVTLHRSGNLALTANKPYRGTDTVEICRVREVIEGDGA